jgi:hypothetical protein
MSDDYAITHKANGLMGGLAAHDVKVVHAYVTLLKLPLSHPLRAGNPGLYNALLDHVSAVRNEPRQYVQEACEALARDLD